MEATQPKPKKKISAVKVKHRKVLTKLAENGGKLAEAIRETGLYSESVARNPDKITNSKTWQELVEEEMPDSLLADVHKSLLNASRLDHMVFPLGPRNEAQRAKYVEQEKAKALKANREWVEQDFLTDDDIAEYLADVNCTLRRIVHGETARHVYFFAADNKARDAALDKGYKLKGRYGNEGVPPPRGNTYNFVFSSEAQAQIRALENGLKQLFTQPNKPQ